MKKLCEIYDVSAEYELKDNSILIVVSDLSKEELYSTMPELKKYISCIMTTENWSNYLDINAAYNRNENKFHKRSERESQYDVFECPTTIISDVEEELENKELSEQIAYALSFLKEQPRRRFLKHYHDHLTYRQIAAEEGRNEKTIRESVNSARKTFLRNFENAPLKTPPSSTNYIEG